LERVNQQTKNFRTLAHRILLWLLQARRPLSILELRQALAVRAEDVDLDKKNVPKEGIMTMVCMCLVVIGRDSSTIRLVYFSMQEYLQKCIEGSESELTFAEKDMISKSCLTILLFDEFGKGYCKSDVEYKLRMQDYPIYLYAALYWPYYAQSEGSNEIMQLTLRFLCDGHRMSSATQKMLNYRQYRYVGYRQNFPGKFTGMHMGSHYGLVEGVEVLLAINWLLDEQDSFGRTLLSYAAENGHEAAVRLLLKKRADVNSRDRFGQTPFSYAAENGHETIARLLLENSPDVNSNDMYSRTLLFYAARAGHETIARLLVENGANVAFRDRFSQRGLSYVVKNKHELVTKLPLEGSAWPDWIDKSAQTPP
jgi:hypothetical protein